MCVGESHPSVGLVFECKRFSQLPFLDNFSISHFHTKGYKNSVAHVKIIVCFPKDFFSIGHVLN